MANKKVVDEKKLLKVIDSGVSQAEVMEKFGFNTSTQLKVAYANALMNAGKVATFKKEVPVKKVVDIEVKVNKRGSLIIPKVLVDKFKLSEGDTFTVRKSQVGLSLKKV